MPVFQFSSVTQSCLPLCDPIDCTMPVFPVYYQLLEPVRTHVHRVGDAIQPSRPLSSPSHCLQSFLASWSFLMSWLCIGWSKYWSFSFSISPSNEYSGLICFRMNWLDLLAVQRTQESSPTPQFKSIKSLVLSFLYGPTITSTHNYWKNHSFDYTLVSNVFSFI